MTRQVRVHEKPSTMERLKGAVKVKETVPRSVSGLFFSLGVWSGRLKAPLTEQNLT